MIADPKHDNFSLLSKATLFKPNLKELCLALGQDLTTSKNALTEAIKNSDLELGRIICVTLGDKGLFYLDRKTGESGHIAGIPISEADVSGAGDTVLAVLTWGLIAGLSTPEMAQLANESGAIVCKKAGVSTVTIEELGAKHLKNKGLLA